MSSTHQLFILQQNDRGSHVGVHFELLESGMEGMSYTSVLRIAKLGCLSTEFPLQKFHTEISVQKKEVEGRRRLEEGKRKERRKRQRQRSMPVCHCAGESEFPL